MNVVSSAILYIDGSIRDPVWDFEGPLPNQLARDFWGSQPHMISPESALAYAKTNWILFAPFVAAILSSMTCSRDDYKRMKNLKRPSYDLPFWVWAVACNSLSMAIGYAVNLIVTNTKLHSVPSYQPVIQFFAVSLITNLLWSPLFLRLRWMGVATISSIISVITGALASYYAFHLNETSGQILAANAGFYAYATLVSAYMYRNNQPRKIRLNKKN